MTMTMIMKATLLLVVMMLATPHSQATPSAHAAADYRSSAPSPTLPCASLANTNTAVLQNGVGSVVVVHQLSRQRTRSCLRPSPIPLLLLLLLLHHQHFCSSAVYSSPKRFLTLTFCTGGKEWCFTRMSRLSLYYVIAIEGHNSPI